MSTKRHRLKSLRVTEASVVDAGANQHAHVMLFKHRDGNVLSRVADKARRLFKMDGGPMTTGEILAQQRAAEALWEVRDAFGESVWRILYESSGEEQLTKLRQTVDEFGEEMGRILPRLASEQAETVQNAVSEIEAALKSEAVSKSATITADGVTRIGKALGALGFEQKNPRSEEMNLKDALEIVKSADAAEDKRAEAADFIEKNVAEQPEPDPVEAHKDSLPEEVVKALETVTKEKDDLAKRLAAIEDEREQEVYLAKAKAIAPAGVEHARLAKVLRSLDEENQATVEQAFAAAKKAGDLAKSLQAEYGLVGHDDDDSATAQLEKLVKSAMESAGIDRPKAFKKVLETPEGARLYSEQRAH